MTTAPESLYHDRGPVHDQIHDDHLLGQVFFLPQCRSLLDWVSVGLRWICQHPFWDHVPFFWPEPQMMTRKASLSWGDNYLCFSPGTGQVSLALGYSKQSWVYLFQLLLAFLFLLLNNTFSYALSCFISLLFTYRIFPLPKFSSAW